MIRAHARTARVYNFDGTTFSRSNVKRGGGEQRWFWPPRS